MLIFRMWLLPCHCRFCPQRLPIRWLWITVSKLLPKQVTYKTKDCWCSVDAHLQHGPVTVSLSLLAIQAADRLNMDNSEQIASQTTYLQDQKSLMLHWGSLSAWGCYRVAFSFPYKGGWYVSYGQQWANCFTINSLTRPMIVDAPMTLIDRMRLLLCRFLFCLERLAMHWSLITASKSLPN